MRRFAAARRAVSRFLFPKSWRRNDVRRAIRFRVEELEGRLVPTVQPVTLADPSLYGLSGQGASSHPSISADGQLVAFTSTAENLVPNDADNAADAFVYNRSTGSVTLVSVGLNGQAAGVTAAPVISPDGRYVVFESTANGQYVSGASGDQLYLRDLSTGTTSLLTASVTGSGGGNRASFDPIFSADSHHLAFLSGADNLLTGYTYDHTVYQVDDIFERDLTTGATTLVTASLDGTAGTNGAYGGYGLSADGRYVAFQSSASNLVALSNSGIEQVYVRDTVAGVTTMVSVDLTGQAGAGGHNELNTDSQVISGDGRYVAFHSNASDLVSGPLNGEGSFLRDLRTGTTVLVSASAVTGAGVNAGGSEVLSPDGRYVAFATTDPNVVSPPTTHTNVYVRDIQTGALTLASVNAAGTGEGNANSGVDTFYDFPGGLSFSPDGQYLAFRSRATNLTAGVVSGSANLYLRDLDTGATQLATPDTAGTDGGNADSDSAVFSGDGRVVAFESTAGNLVAGDNNGQQDVFVRDIAAGATALASSRSPLMPAAYPTNYGGTLNQSSVSSDGRYVAFTSYVFYGVTTSPLAPGVTFSSTFSMDHVFVRDRQTGAVKVVDLDSTGTAVGGFNPVITPDGRYVAFFGYTNLLPSGVATTDPHDWEIYVRDLQTNTTSVVSLTPDGTHDAPVDGTDLAISSDGRYVAWTSTDVGAVTGTVSGSPGNYHTIFLRDTQTGTNYLVSHDAANDGQVSGNSQHLSLSSNGQFVAFTSTASNLTANDTNNKPDVFEWNRATGAVALVSVNAAGTGPGNNDSYNGYAPAMTPDGRYIAFTSSATNLTATATTREDVFLRDTVANTTTLVGVNSAGTGESNNTSYGPSISSDGTKVAFVSYSSNLTATANASTPNIFLRNLTAGTNTLVSVNSAGTASGNQGSFGVHNLAPVLSADGRYVVFASQAGNLVPGFVDGNGSSYDLYARDTQAGLTKLLTANQSGTAGANADESGDIVELSGDGSTVVFESSASDLFAGDRNYQEDIFAATTAGHSSIGGQVFNDANGNGTQDGGETGRQYWTVFADTNGNGTLDAGEPSALTDANGSYALTGLTPGTYTIRAVAQPGNVQTTPASSFSVTIAADGTQITGKNFGEEQLFP
jgi:Tol biopolymer transport system component